MAFSRRRRIEDGAVEPEMAEGPHLERRRFFKIILSDTLESGKLGIPKSFLRRWGKDLSDSVLLQVPGHSTWTIELEKRNNDMVSLLKGWREFMKYYSIGHGHLIVFKYKGNSTFCVIIFDKSTLEIDYSLSSSKSSYCGSKFTSPKTEDVIEAEDLQDVASHQRMRVKRHLPCSQPSPIYSRRRSEACIDPDPEVPDQSKAPADLRDMIQQSTCRVRHRGLIFHGLTLPRSPTSPQVACNFDSEHPFFKMVIPQSYMNCLNIPSGFIKQHIPENKGMATLRFSGKSWPVKLLSYIQTRKTKKPLRYTHDTRVSFSSGWPAFARETHVRVGHVCVFELIDRDDAVFRVSNFSIADGMEQPTCKESCSEPDLHDSTIPRSLRSPELTSDIDTVQPFFKLVIPQSYASCLGVPVGFAKQHLQEDKHLAILWYSDRSWPVKLIRLHGRARGTSRTFFSAGWRAFARGTHVLAGNVCMFELFNRDDIVFKVSILRGADNDTIHVDLR